MYTRLKPQRVKTSNVPTPGQGLGYIDEENFEWTDIVGDMKYADFEWVTLTGSTLTIEDINTNVTPSGNFTVSAGTVLPGIEYTLRVNTGNTAYTMSLGSGITNPNSYDITLKPNAVNQFKFIATSTSQLELEGVDGAFVTINTAQSISGKKTFTTEPALPNKTTAATNDGTKPATEAQVYPKADDDKVVHKAGAETITGVKTFQAEPVLPNKTGAAVNDGTKPATEKQVYDVDADLDQLDGNVVKLSGDQTIAGTKTFSTSPVVPNKTAAPTNSGTAIATEKQVYDVKQDLNTLDSNAVKITGDQNVNGTKTFGTSPVVPSKTTDATDTGTAIATEAQVYKKANKVASATADNLASLTSAGDLADSGIAKGTVELNTNKETGDAPTDSTTKYPSSHTVKKYVDDQVSAATAGAVSNTAYDATTWDGVTGIAPSKNAVRDKIVSMDSNISTNATDISTINGKIPSEASTTNQLADKEYVSDSINSIAAYYITKDANGNQFATYAELAAATTFYSGGVVRVPTMNDYTIVLDDENHDHATTRYIYNNGWEYQYTINETPLTQAQLDALNSGITAGKVSTYDAYATNKQATLVSGTNIKTINNTSILGSGNIDTNQVSDTAYGSGWDGVTGTAPSKNAVYDKISAMDTTIGNKANDSDVVKLSGNQTISGTKTFETSPVVPSKTTDAGDNGTAIATEAQVYKKQDTLISGYTLKLVNNNSLLGSGNVFINEVKISATAPTTPIEGSIWYDTTNDVLKTYNGSTWIAVGVGNGDVKYSDFNWQAKTGATVTLDLACTITPSANFTVNAPATIKDGQSYILRVNNGATAYTMTLGTNITNPYNTSLTLTAGGVDQFLFLAIGGNLELQPEALGFEANSGGVRTFDLPSNGSDMAAAIEWITAGGGAQFRTISSNVESYYKVTSRDGTNRTIICENNSGPVTTRYTITYTAAGLCSGITSATEGNTKIFTLSSTSDLTTAQAAHDWYANGGNPIMKYSSSYYTPYIQTSTYMQFFRIRTWNNPSAPNTRMQMDTINLTISNSSVTTITNYVNQINLATSAPTSVNNNTITFVI